MTIAYTGGNNNIGTSAAPSTGTHGITINSGDLVVVYVNSNNTGAIAADSGGTTFTEALEVSAPGGNSCAHALYYKIAGASEPTAYTFTAGNAQWHVIIKVFSGDSLTVDAAANAAVSTSYAGKLHCTAISGETISDNALSVIFGGRDTRSGANEAYTVADNSYTGVLGHNGSEATGGAHRIFTTGTSSISEVIIEPTDESDGLTSVIYSMHMSFVESGGGSSIVPQAMYHYTKNTGSGL